MVAKAARAPPPAPTDRQDLATFSRRQDLLFPHAQAPPRNRMRAITRGRLHDETPESPLCRSYLFPRER